MNTQKRFKIINLGYINTETRNTLLNLANLSGNINKLNQYDYKKYGKPYLIMILYERGDRYERTRQNSYRYGKNTKNSYRLWNCIIN